MRIILFVVMLLVFAAAAEAQDTEANMLGMFLHATVFADSTTNMDTDSNTPFDGHVVILGATMAEIDGYELGIRFTSDDWIWVLQVGGDHGWFNRGDNLNHDVEFWTPKPVDPGGTVLTTLTLLNSWDGLPVFVTFIPYVESSIPGHPVVFDAADPTVPIAATYTTATGVVATFNWEGVVATQETSWSGVKRLFEDHR